MSLWPDPCLCAVCHVGGRIFLSMQCLEVAGNAKGELDGCGGKMHRIVNESRGLRLVLRPYLMGPPLLGPPLPFYNPTATTCDLKGRPMKGRVGDSAMQRLGFVRPKN